MKRFNYWEFCANNVVSCKALIVALFVTMAPSALWAHDFGKPSSCSSLFQNFTGDLEIARVDTSFSEPHDNGSSYRVDAMVTSTRGETFLKIVRTHPKTTWWDKKNEVDKFKGNIEQFFDFDGDSLRILGFYKSNSTFYIPTAGTLNMRIGLINKQLGLEDQIKIKFYSIKGLVDPILHVRKFVEGLELPVSIDGKEASHDILSHSPAVFIPFYLLEHFRRQIKTTIDFGDYIIDKHPEILDLPGYGTYTVREWINQTNLRASEKIDDFTAEKSWYLGLTYMGQGMSPMDFAKKSYGFSMGQQPSAHLHDAFVEFYQSQAKNKIAFERLNFDIKKAILEVGERRRMLLNLR
jgi:hypothetical protein